MKRTVETFATEQGRSVDEVLAACKRSGVIAWSATTPLDDEEVIKVLEALTPAPDLPPPGVSSGALPPPPPPPPPPGGWSPQTSPAGPSAIRILGTIGAIFGLVVLVLLAAVVFLGEGAEPRFEAIDPGSFGQVGESTIDTTLPTTSSTTTPAHASVTCFDDLEADVPPDQWPGGIPFSEVECTGPHDLERYAEIDYPGGEGVAYPGVEALQAYASDACAESFADSVGLPIDQVPVAQTNLVPSVDSWDGGDRLIECRIRSLDGSPLPALGGLR